ncbi:hypothetical protein H6P81_018612 [Aristolochia fimbriata]|uniref:Retroviral polymerase SH3-like domain-containing protein n=1 Tax=Aristolochia fimbriata TaxID=158543 RepID=A0AAV7E5V8_ARIFI|nr:hypothetical protein H6P81_018612 [Aristolochia fimbriata]
MAAYPNEWASNTTPPSLDETNYSYWKAKMQIYIKAQDERAWRSVEVGWTPPTKEVGEGADKKRILKPSSEWTDEEDRLSFKSLNAIFGGIDEDQFRRVSMCTTAKEAWKILEVHYEGTESVRAMKLRMLMTQFELMRMRDDETILEFEGKIRDIANQSANLGDRILQDLLVKKWDGVLESTKVLREQVGALERENVVLKQKLGEKEAEVQKIESEESLLKERISVLDEENRTLKQEVAEKEERIIRVEEELKKSKEIWVKFDRGKQQLDDILTQEKRGNLTATSCKDIGEGMGVVEWLNLLLQILSGHMTGSTKFLTNLHKESGGQVTFGDGAKGSLIGKGDLNVRLPKRCMEGKQHRTPHTALKFITTKQPLELLHIDLMGPVQTESIAGKRYLTHKTLYELWKGRKPNVHYFREFGSRCHVLRDREQLRKFDSRSIEGIFAGYSRNSNAYRVFLRSANIVIETVTVEISDQNADLQKLDDEHVPSIQKGETIKQRVDGIFISQEKYAKNLVRKFGLEDAKSMRTPMSTTDRICRDENGTPTDPTLYRCMIGSLLYLTASRPDICYSVGLCARFQSAPKESHVKSVKRSIRYVKNIVNLGIWYVANTSNVLAGYSDADWVGDADWAGDADDRKSTSCGCFYLGTNLMSWYSKK